MRTILISGFYSKFQTDLIIGAFGKNKKIKIDTWITKEHNFNYIKNMISTSELLDNYDCIRGINFSRNTNKKIKLNKLIRFSDDFSTTFIEMMTRFDPNNLYDKKYRIDHFHFLLKNWALKITNRKINKVLFFCNPHTLFDYAIYVVCKYYKIETIILEDTKYFAAAFFTKTIEGLSSFSKNYKKISSKRISQKTKIFIQSNKILSTTRYNGNIDALSEIPFKHEVSFLRIFYWAFVKPFMNNNFNLFKIYHYFFTKQKRAIWNYSNLKYYDKRSMPTLFQDQYYYFKKNYLFKKLKKSYNSLSICPNFKENYVVFYDSINPEKSVVPDAINFLNIIKVLKEIRKNIPNHWYIYYKEHPAAYSLHFETHLTKKNTFYKELLAIPNLNIIKFSTDKKKLLINSKFSITRTGEIGFQSVVNNVPSLNLGNTWYSSCAGVIHLKNLKEIKKGINSILKIKNIKINEIKSFLNKVENESYDVSYRGVNLNYLKYYELKKQATFKKKFNSIIKNFKKRIPI